MNLRQASPADAAAIAQIEVPSQQHGFKGILDKNYLKSLDVTARTAHWQKFLSNKAEPSFIYLVEDDLVPRGFVCVGPGRDPGFDGCAEIQAMFVAPEYYSKGVGKKLLAAAYQYAEKYMYQRVYGWLPPGHEKARAFFRTNGASEDPREKKTFTYGETSYAGVMMVFALDY